jgi:pseudoazurin|tara:strand:- start:36 stop:479 length:444 start_codon:yes stop_codon:yes gene_type:complete
MEPVMRILPALFILTTLLIFSKGASAETVEIEFTKFDTYSIEVVHIDVGDSVEWLPESVGHNVEFIAGPNMNALPKSSKMDDLHSVVFKMPGIYLYGCTPHLNMGMLGLVIVGNDLHNLEKLHDVKLSRIAKSILANLIITAKLYSE